MYPSKNKLFFCSTVSIRTNNFSIYLKINEIQHFQQFLTCHDTAERTQYSKQNGMKISSPRPQKACMPLFSMLFLFWGAHTRGGEIPLFFCTWHESCGMRALFVARSCAGKWQLSSIGTRIVPRSTGVEFRPNTGPDGLKHTASFGLAAYRPVFRICLGSSYHADRSQAKEATIGVKKKHDNQDNHDKFPKK